MHYQDRCDPGRCRTEVFREGSFVDYRNQNHGDDPEDSKANRSLKLGGFLDQRCYCF